MKEQLRILLRLGAPKKLVEDFKAKCETNDSLPADLKASHRELLEGTCRTYSFHDILPEGWFFRPKRLGNLSFKEDGAVSGNEPEAAVIEQAYRRGFCQGFADYRQLLADGATSTRLAAREREIDAWRRRSIQKFRSRPGDKEKPPKALFGSRASISLRLRHEVLKRDGFRCKHCGNGPVDGVRLELDHILPHSLGGDDTMANLQTLCSLCNSGKSNTPHD